MKNQSVALNNGLLAIAGFIAIIAGLAFNAYLFTTYSTGLGMPMQVAMALLGVVMDVIKISLIVLFFTILIPTGKYGMAFFAAVFAILLTSLSLFSGFGSQINILTKSEQAVIDGSQAKVLAQNNLDAARENVDNLSSAAGLSVSTIQSQINDLLNSTPMNSRGTVVNSTLGSLTSNCSNTKTFYYRYCSDYAGLSSQLHDAQAYQAAKTLLAEKENAVLSIGTASENETLGINPVFIYASSLTGYTPREIKSFIGSMISLLLEFIGTLALIVSNYTRRAIGNTYEHNPSYSAQNGVLSNDTNEVIQSLKDEVKLLKNASKGVKKGQDESTLLSSHATGFVSKENDLDLDMQLPLKKKAIISKKGQDESTVLSTRADSDVNGQNSTRFNALKRAILRKQIKPTLADILKFKHGDIGINRTVAKRYQVELASQGIITAVTLPNGRQSYVLNSEEV